MKYTRSDEQKVIARFGKEMQFKLDERNKKGRMGWRSKRITTLFNLLMKEVNELEDAIFCCKYCNVVKDINIEDVKKECADIANFCMMIHDVVGRKKV